MSSMTSSLSNFGGFPLFGVYSRMLGLGLGILISAILGIRF